MVLTARRVCLLCFLLLTGCSGGSYDNSLSAANAGPENDLRPTINLSPTNFAFSVTQGDANPVHTVDISNTGNGTLDWSASTTAPWLALTPSSGAPSGNARMSFSAEANLSSLAVGTYSATITVIGVGATNTPQAIPVTLIISPPRSLTSTSSTTMALSLDVNDDGLATPQDAIVILRYLSLVTGPALTAGVVTGGNRTDPTQIKTYLDGARNTMLDVNLDGQATPQDAIVILRHLSLVSGPALIAGVITGGSQTDPALIKSYLDAYMPGATPRTTTGIAWDATDPGVSGYYVHYGTQSPNLAGSCAYEQSIYYSLAALASPPSPTATISGLTTGITYYFAVSAYNGSLKSACSNEIWKPM